MSKKIDTKFTFYPVGQGCFYAGSIKTETDEFVIVYDCGTVSKVQYLNDAIEEFKSKHKKIDLLMISHFDKDHVNGLKILLDGIDCELVVIPYYLPIIRLALYGNNGTNDDDDYGLFLKDPVDYFLDTDKFNVKQVIVLENGNENQEDFITAPEPNSPEKQLELIEKILLDKVKDNDEEFKNKVIYEEENEPRSDKNIKYLSLPFKLSISNEFWEFIFYLKNFNKPTGLDDFREEINRMLTKTRDGKLSSLFDEIYILKIKELYKKHLASDINYTSLVVFHGPTKSNTYTELWIDRYCHWWSHFEPTKNIGTLLTGDSFLKTTNDFNSFFNYYSPYYIKNCFFFQVPHHGSKRNWKNLPNGLENIPFYIINHGWGRKKHPNKDVIDNIITNYNGNLIYNNEASRVTYCMKIR